MKVVKNFNLGIINNGVMTLTDKKEDEVKGKSLVAVLNLK